MLLGNFQFFLVYLCFFGGYPGHVAAVMFSSFSSRLCIGAGPTGALLQHPVWLLSVLPPVQESMVQLLVLHDALWPSILLFGMLGSNGQYCGDGV